MNNPTTPPLSETEIVAPTKLSATRPRYWSVRRELWEHRSIYIAPLAVAGVAIVAFFFGLVDLPKSIQALPSMDPVHRQIEVAMPFAHSAVLLMAAGLLVAVFYSLDALHGERRERSILLWKSLPVSDCTTVLSKAAIPIVVLPLLIFAITIVLQLAMLLISVTFLVIRGGGAETLLTRLPLFQMEVGLLYALAVTTLWYAPIYGWLMLVSGWARRATFLWAALPLAAIVAFEAIAFHTWHFAHLLRDRAIGFAPKAFDFRMPDGSSIDPHFIPLGQFTPGRFLGTPELWIGLIIATVCLTAAVRLRRYRDPV